MTVLHKKGHCWCREKHSAVAAFILNTRDIPTVKGTPTNIRVPRKRGRPPKRGS